MEYDGFLKKKRIPPKGDLVAIIIKTLGVVLHNDGKEQLTPQRLEG